jgi:hypothetical protein
MQLRGRTAGTATFGESTVQGPAPASHSGITISSGEVGGSSALSVGD